MRSRKGILLFIDGRSDCVGWGLVLVGACLLALGGASLAAAQMRPELELLSETEAQTVVRRARECVGYQSLTPPGHRVVQPGRRLHGLRIVPIVCWAPHRFWIVLGFAEGPVTVLEDHAVNRWVPGSVQSISFRDLNHDNVPDLVVSAWGRERRSQTSSDVGVVDFWLGSRNGRWLADVEARAILDREGLRGELEQVLLRLRRHYHPLAERSRATAR